jgi:hypothetical protein
LFLNLPDILVVFQLQLIAIKIFMVPKNIFNDGPKQSYSSN